MSNRKFITYEQAIELLPEGEQIYTFRSPGHTIIGAEWSRQDILDKLKNSEIIKLTEGLPRALHHGICAYDKDTKYLLDALFIETDEEKLSAFEERQGVGE